MRTDTIAAIATGLNHAGISIIRISGSDVDSIMNQIFVTPSGKRGVKEIPGYTARYGYITDGDSVIDEVLVLVMRAPKSYTREDVVEIDCHGGIVVTRKILETVIRHGARPAEPGEFTKRAFLNGRIDLSQAEAVIDIIQSKNEMALKNSVNQLKGSIHKKLKQVRDSILRDTAYIEAALDDPEHISLDGFTEELKERIQGNLHVIDHLIESADNGKLLKEGIQTVILGKPNAGKSSLMNLLAGDEKAIVTEIAGTTRDVLEEMIQIKGISFNVIDTAGIRDTEDTVEKIGVEKARRYAKDADLIIYVADSSVPLDENDDEIIEFIQDKKAIVLLNKSDLAPVVDVDLLTKRTGRTVIKISAVEETGIEDLERTVADMFFHGDLSFNDEIYITNMRQKASLIEAEHSLRQVLDSIENQMPEDFYSIDLMNAYEELGRITGESVDEDLIDTIFREFCMGK
ncbi:MAG: tRNA uridine-5-carboxymethylaminomethyl(34) synthesis GTPase MnmE [Lachnospiraceae bacterium]|nr:tRNA uridine-5-carboxymethylaminomethyl(34) synthesis GTPase MnmE [Lachnospiraceae bacterium]